MGISTLDRESSVQEPSLFVSCLQDGSQEHLGSFEVRLFDWDNFTSIFASSKDIATLSIWLFSFFFEGSYFNALERAETLKLLKFCFKAQPTVILFLLLRPCTNTENDGRTSFTCVTSLAAMCKGPCRQEVLTPSEGSGNSISSFSL